MRRSVLIARRNRRQHAGSAAVLALLSLLSACAIKNPPPASELRERTLSHAPLPEKWSANIVTEGAVQDGWISTFNDPTLQALVAEALQYNTDLRVAAARVAQAAGYARVAGAAIYPAVNLLARGGGPLSGDGSGLEGAWLNASWELDLWGRVRANRAAAATQYEATEADYIYARQALAAAVAKSWFLAIEARLQRSIAEEMVVAGERLVDVARQRLRVGADDEYNVVVAEASLGGFRDTLLQLEFGYQQAARALEVLLGRYPAATIETAGQLPALPPPIPAGLPSELLERRPDIVAAERRVAAAFHRVSEAKAARLPKISLTATVSTISSELFVLQDRDNPVWSAGASLLAPIFQGGALVAQVEIRTAEQEQALAEYARAGLRAFNDVESAMHSELMLRSREQVLTRAVADNMRALQLAEVRYRVGATDLRAVSQQQLDLLAAQTTLLRVRSEARVQRVNLHLTLGGSFAAGNEARAAGQACPGCGLGTPPREEPPPPEKTNSTAGAANR